MSNPLLKQVLDQLCEPFPEKVLFDVMVDMVFFIKNNKAQYLHVNQTLAQRCGFADKDELIGKTAADIFALPLGENYLAQDLCLIGTGKPLLNELELHTYPAGETGWCITNKLPLRSRNGECIGIIGVSRDLHAPDNDYRDVAEAIRHAQLRLDEPLTVENISQNTNLSPFQFDRRIRDVFHVSTSQLILKFRLDRATQLLRDTSLPISHIALDCGYSDQSSFTRQFHRTIGLTPADYRKRHREDVANRPSPPSL